MTTPKSPLPRKRFWGPRQVTANDDRGIVSTLDWRHRRIRWTLLLIQGATLAFLLVIGLGPLLWLAKASITPTQDTLRTPMALWPNGFDLGYLATAWSQTHIDRYFMNTVWIAIGSWICQLLVATTAGYALSILKPRFSRILTGLVLATLFVPSIVLLVPLYLSIVDVPFLHIKLINSFWAVWLPAGASAFNVLLVKRFFDNLPREIFEAARVDGAGPFRMFWSIVLPMSRPILGVVSVFAVMPPGRTSCGHCWYCPIRTSSRCPCGCPPCSQRLNSTSSWRRWLSPR